MPHTFDETTENSGVFLVSGDLDLRSGPALRADLLHRIASGWRQIVVDLAAVVGADNSGLSALVGALGAARRAGGDVRLAGPTGSVLGLLQHTGLDTIFALHPNAAAAAAAYRPPGT